jgi:hypothetical protein
VRSSPTTAKHVLKLGHEKPSTVLSRVSGPGEEGGVQFGGNTAVPAGAVNVPVSLPERLPDIDPLTAIVPDPIR